MLYLSRSGLASVFIGFLVIMGVVSGVTHGAQENKFELTISPSVNVPDRKVTFDTGELTITTTVTEIGRTDVGEPFSAKITAPENETYRVLLYNADRQIVDSKSLEGDDTATFPTKNIPPGNYMMVLSNRGVFEQFSPVVVQSHQITVDAPSEAEVNDSITVQASVTKIADGKELETVTLVIGNKRNEERTEMTKQSDGTYTASISLDSLPAGDYKLYGVVQGNKTVFGRLELLGVSNSKEFDLTAPSTQTETTNDENDADSTDSSQNPEEPTSPSPTPTVTATPIVITVSPTPTPTPTRSPASTRTETQMLDQSATQAVSNGSTSTRTETPTNLITPNSTLQTTDGSTESPGQPLGMLPIMIALVLATLQLLYRDSR